MKCIECGHELKDGAVFCIRCGAMQVSMDGNAKATGDTPTVRPAVGNTQNAGATGRHTKDFKPTPRRSTASVVVPIVAVVAVLAAVGALAMFVINPGSSGQSASSQASNAQTVAVTSSSSASASSSSSSSSSSASSKSSTSASASSKSASAASTSSTSSASSAASSSNNNATANNQAPTIVEPEPEPVYYGDDSYYLWDTSDRYYSRDEVENLSNYDLYYARNEIYARHGRMFNNADLQNYFNSKSWYNPIYTPEQFDSMANPLSDVEQANSKLMLEVEQSRNSPYV